MAINTIDNFSYKGAKPLDARLVFNTLDEMTSYPKENLYVGIIMYCRETSKHYTYNGISIDEMSMGSGTGGSIDESKFALKSELDEFDTEAYKVEVNAFIDKAKKDVLTVDKFDKFDINAYKNEVNTFIDEAKKDILTVDKFDAFDTKVYKTEIETMINNSKQELITMDRLTEFDPIAYEAEVDAYINNAKKDVLTVDKFDTFNPKAYKEEVQNMINAGKQELITMDKLVELDLVQL